MESILAVEEEHADEMLDLLSSHPDEDKNQKH